MVRGTFANIRLQNNLVNKKGGFTKYFPSEDEGEVFDIAKKYKDENTPLVVIAGKEYGTGSSRDWAAKGTKLLGIKCVIAESYERIHRSNLVGMGVLPLQFVDNDVESLNLDGSELFYIGCLEDYLIKPNIQKSIKIINVDKKESFIQVQSRIDTDKEIRYFKSGGILPFVLSKLV
jgi:aconitate hydratase